MGLFLLIVKPEDSFIFLIDDKGVCPAQIFLLSDHFPFRTGLWQSINLSFSANGSCFVPTHPNFIWRDPEAAGTIHPLEVNVFISYNCLHSVLANLSLLVT